MLFSFSSWLQQFAPAVSSRRIQKQILRQRACARVRYRLVERLEDRTLLTDAPLISISDASMTEGDSGTTNLTFTVTRTGDTTSEIEVAYSTSNGTATAGSDYTAVTGTVVIPAGQATATIDVPITGDMLVEADETFSVNLTGVTSHSADEFPLRYSFDSGGDVDQVAIGDFNADGKPDIAVTGVILNTLDTQLVVFLNTTPTGSSLPSFAAPETIDTGMGPGRLAISDLNGDGRLDIAVAGGIWLSGNTVDVAVLLNTTVPGSPTVSFAPAVQFPDGVGGANDIKIADFNQDGKPDLIYTDFSDKVSVLINHTVTGSLTAAFSDPFDVSVPFQSWHVNVADLNDDGKPDIISMSGFIDSHLSILFNTTPLGDETPSFGDLQEIPVVTMPSDCAVGDINGDGKLDLAFIIADGGLDSDTVTVLLNTTQGGAATFTFAGRTDYVIDNYPQTVKLQDVNNDGTLDLVIATYRFDKVDLLLNQTAPGSLTPTFIAGQILEPPTGPFDATAVDVNNDSFPDIITGNHGGLSFSVFLNGAGDTQVQLADAQQVPQASSLTSVAAADFNLDGTLDLAGTDASFQTVVLQGMTPTGAAQPNFGDAQVFDGGDNAQEVVTGDFNGDGKPDLAVANPDLGVIAVLLNTTGPGSPIFTFTHAVDFDAGINPQSLNVADMNGDGKLDIVAADPGSNSVVVLLNSTIDHNSIPSFDGIEPFDAGDSPYSIVVGDLNGDGLPDVAIANRDAGAVSVLLNTTVAGSATVSFATLEEFSVAPNTHSARVSMGDLNADGMLDLVITNPKSIHQPADNYFSVLVNTTTAGDNAASFAPSQKIFSGRNSSPSLAVVGDVTGDGLADIAILGADAGAVHQLFGGVSVFPNQTPVGSTTLTFADAWLYEFPLPHFVADDHVSLGLYDFNDNGILDVVIGVSSDPASFLMSGGPAIADGLGIGTIINDDVDPPPIVDLNGSDDAGTAYTSSFTEGQGAVNIAQSDATVTDANDPELVSMQLVFGAIFDAGNEVVTIAGVSFPLNFNKTSTAIAGGTSFKINYSTPARTFTIIKNGGGSAPSADFQSLLRTVTYNNLSTIPNPTPRTISVTANDGFSSGPAAVATINVTPVNSAPTDLSVSPSSVGENLPSGTLVGTFSTVDPDIGDTFTYALVAGAGSSDNGSFTIVNGQLRTAASFNFEAKATYSIRVRTTDFGGLSFEKPLTIAITNNNDAPTDIALSSNSVPENQSVGTVIGNLSTSDEDAGDAFVYAFVSGLGGSDNGFFAVVGNHLQVAAPLDFEARSLYSIRLRTTDIGGASFEKVFAIIVTNVNEAPTNVALAPATIAENEPAGRLVGMLSSTDQDAASTFSYSLVAGAGSTDNARFTIGNGQVFALETFDFEAKASYTVRIRTTDQGGLTFEKPITITVTDANDAPTDVGIAPASIAENQPVGTAVADLTSTDPDVGNTFTYQLVPGTGSTDNARFSIANGQLVAAEVFDYETRNTYSIRVRTTDQGGLSFEKPVTVTIANANDPPTDVTLSGNTVAENRPNGTVIGTFSATDPDADTVFTYSLVTGVGDNDNTAFTISNGQLLTAASFNFEAKSTYSIRVRAVDQGGLSVEKALTITVTNVNEAPTTINLFPMSIAENQPAGSVVGTLSTTDPDLGNTFTYALVSGSGATDNASFTIANGQLLTAASFDFETQDLFSIRIRTTDQGGLSVEKSLLINTLNANETPVITAGQSFTVAENSPLNTVVGTVASTDPDLIAPLNSRLFSITDGNTLNAFSIDSGTGQLKVANPAALNFEATPTFLLLISLMDGGGAEAVPQTVTIHLSDVNEVPVISPVGPQSLAEDAPNGHAIIAVSDPETSVGDLTVQFTSSNQALIPDGNLSFNDSGASLDLHYVPAADQSGVTTITLTLSDGVNTVTRSFDVTVVAENDAPRISEISPQTMDEDNPGGPYSFTVNDPDNDIGSLTMSVSSTNQSLISDASLNMEGVGTARTLAVTPAANRSGQTVITITVSDGTLTTTQEFQITVDAVDDPPTIILNPAPLSDARGFHKPVRIDDGAIITDIDTPTLNFGHAVLTVSGPVAHERLLIRKGDGIRRKGKTVQFNGAVIGALAGGKKGLPLTVTFNATAAQPAVQALLRHIGFKTHSTDPERTISMQVTNIDGIDTNVATRTMEI